MNTIYIYIFNVIRDTEPKASLENEFNLAPVISVDVLEICMRMITMFNNARINQLTSCNDFTMSYIGNDPRNLFHNAYF